MTEYGYVIVVLTSLISTFISLVTKKYPDTANFLVKNSYVYLYLLYYGFIGFLVWYLIQSKIIDFKIASYDGVILQAAIAGFLTYQLSQVTLESKIGSDSHKFNLSSLFHKVDGWIEKQLDNEHNRKLQAYLQSKHPALLAQNVDVIKQRISQYVNDLDGIKTLQAKFERVSVLGEVEDCTSTRRALLLYLSSCGAKEFDATFA